MLQTASQYLHHEYLQPLPTTLDAKKSPLALLAQTCSNIGKDTTPAKPLIPPIEKKDGRTSSEKSSSDHDKRSSPADKKDSKTPSSAPPKEMPSLVPITHSPNSGKYSPSTGSPKTRSPVNAHTPVSSSHSPIPSAHSNTHYSLALDSKHGDVKTSSESKTGLSSQPTQPTPGATLKPTAVPVSGAASYSHHPGLDPHLLGHPFALDPSSIHSANAAYTSALAAHASLARSGHDLAALSGGSSVSPYVAYAQVKTATGATTLVPICRDPYCTNCQLTMRSAQLSGTCAAGCTQCNHEKSLAASSSLGLSGTPLTVPVLPVPGASQLSGTNGLGSLYSHSLMAAHHGLPYVCNWMSGTDHCGKRFSTSEELLQHLRTHTSSTDISTSLSLASVLPSYSYPSVSMPSVSVASTLGSHYSHGSLSPNSLHRNYPTSLSPISSALAASRYHPYAKSAGLSSLSSAAPSMPPMPFPSMGPYYSPYALYGQRLGAAVAP
ncbi:zinc finger protein Noc-like [Lineus longissimus]|uniref:zinc finger protein Noc-like n=1 Tax=Lineus longissimus TaxID=88925 RepID=UPI002B4F3612